MSTKKERARFEEIKDCLGGKIHSLREWGYVAMYLSVFTDNSQRLSSNLVEFGCDTDYIDSIIKNTEITPFNVVFDRVNSVLDGKKAKKLGDWERIVTEITKEDFMFDPFYLPLIIKKLRPDLNEENILRIETIAGYLWQTALSRKMKG